MWVEAFCSAMGIGCFKHVCIDLFGLVLFVICSSGVFGKIIIGLLKFGGNFMMVGVGLGGSVSIAPGG